MAQDSDGNDGRTVVGGSRSPGGPARPGSDWPQQGQQGGPGWPPQQGPAPYPQQSQPPGQGWPPQQGQPQYPQQSQPPFPHQGQPQYPQQSQPPFPQQSQRPGSGWPPAQPPAAPGWPQQSQRPGSGWPPATGPEATRVGNTFGPAPPQQSQRPGTDPFGGDRTARSLVPGAVLNNTYRIDAAIARGGMGEVYRATNLVTQEPVAVKTIRPEFTGDPKVVELFRREALALRKVHNPAIVGYEGVFASETGQLYLAMEFVDGPSLASVIKKGPIAPDAVRRLRERLAGGLAVAHAQGVIHRDLSPDNVILAGGRLEEAKIIDFGIAKQTEGPKGTMIGSDFAGKYAYVAPEQLGLHGGHVDERSDIYSLGLVLAAAASGAPLDMGDSPGTAVAARQKVPDLARVPAELRAELSKLLQPDPKKRPAAMAALAGAAGPALTRAPPAAAAARKAAPAGDGKGAMRAAIFGGVALGVLALLGAGYWVWDDAVSGPAGGGIVQGGSAGGGSAGAAGGGTAGGQVDRPGGGAGGQVAALDPAVIRGRINDEVGRLRCAGLQATLDSGNDVMVRGWVQSEDDRAALVAALGRIQGVRAVQQMVVIRPWPVCETLLAAAPHLSGDLQILLNRPNGSYQVDRDRFSFRIQTPPGQRAFVSISVVNTDGTVFHAPDWAQLQTNGDQPIVVGEGASVLTFGPPPGQMVLVATYSREPLFQGARPNGEPVAAFLSALRTALAGRSDAGVQLQVIVTTP